MKAFTKEDLEKELKFNVRSLGVDKLKTIYYVGLTESMTKAGDLMGLCQSAVSRQIQTLEDDLGFIMFKRKDRKVEITKEGKIMMQLSQKSLYEMDATVKSIKEARENLSGTLKILTFPSFASVMVPKYLRNFPQAYPDMDVEVISTFEEMPITETDVTIRAFIPKHPQLTQLLLYKQYLGLYAHKSYLEEWGTPKTLEDLDNHQLLGIHPALEKRYRNINWILKVGIHDSIHYREARMCVSSNDALANTVIAGMGIASLCVHHAKILNHPDVVRVLPNYGTENGEIFLSFNGDVTHKDRYMALYEHLKAEIEKDKDSFLPD